MIMILGLLNFFSMCCALIKPGGKKRNNKQTATAGNLPTGNVFLAQDFKNNY